MLRIYQLITILFSPLIDLYLLIRLLRGKEEYLRFKERLGYSTIKRPNEKIIWFQCASVGESNSALPLIDKIIEKYNEKVTILITSGTTTSSKILENKLKNKKNVIHQYTPVDKYFVIKRFIKYWKPEALITVESEIWPNMITQSHKIIGKVMIANAKVSKRSFRRWRYFKGLKESVFDSIDVCYPQSLEDQFRLIRLGIQNTIFLGNLKFDIPKLKINNELFTDIENSIKNRKSILFASTHKGEDKIILEIYKNIQSHFSNLIFLIALRHPNRSNEVYNFFTSHNLNVKRKSKNEKIDNETNIYLYDEIGEMGTLFEVNDIVVMCGSLVDGIGGHTPVEPTRHMCAIVTGPYIRNNKSLFVELRKNDAGIIIRKKYHGLLKDLENTLRELIYDKNKVNELQNNAYKVSEKFSHVANNVARNIVENLNKNNLL